MDKSKDEPATTSTTADEDALNKVISQGIKFDVAPLPGATPPAVPPATIDSHTSSMVEPKINVKVEEPKEEAPTVKPLSEPAGDTASPKPLSSDLEKIKKAALEDLRPLVSKLDLTPEEKFDTLLLIIRSTDDQSLLGEIHETAKKITDETKKAQALLDVIKEVDYFGNKA